MLQKRFKLDRRKIFLKVLSAETSNKPIMNLGRWWAPWPEGVYEQVRLDQLGKL